MYHTMPGQVKENFILRCDWVDKARKRVDDEEVYSRNAYGRGSQEEKETI